MSIFKLTPAYKDYLWGGERLVSDYKKTPNALPCAESWELSLHPDGLTTVDGVPLRELLGARELGENAASFKEFPTLIKFIDAEQNLSVQVHPSDSYALEHESGCGKTEMWYIVEADDTAGIYLGFSKNITKSEIEDAIKNNTLCSILNFVPVKSGEYYFVPSGTVHAIGAGTIILEIQQNSNLTYRVYDYGRVDKNGKTRELHIDKALAVMKTESYSLPPLPEGVLGISKYFTVRKYCVEEKLNFPRDSASFRCVTAVSGSGAISGKKLSAGDSYFVTADEDGFTVTGNVAVVITEIRQYSVKIERRAHGYVARLVDDLGRIVFTECEATESEASKKLSQLTAPYFS